MAVLLFFILSKEDPNSIQFSHRPPLINRPVAESEGTIFSKGFGKEHEFDVVLRMDGKLIETRVYGSGTLEQSRIVCEKNNGTLPWRTFTVEYVKARGNTEISYIKSRLFWLNTTIQHPVNTTSLSEKVGGPISSTLEKLENQIVGLYIENGKNATYCALRYLKLFSLYYYF